MGGFASMGFVFVTARPATLETDDGSALTCAAGGTVDVARTGFVFAGTEEPVRKAKC